MTSFYYNLAPILGTFIKYYCCPLKLFEPKN